MSDWFERHGWRARGQAGYRREYQTLDHIFSVQNAIKGYCCFAEFRRAFDMVPRHVLIEWTNTPKVPNLLVSIVIGLYENVVGRFHSSHVL